MKYIFLASVYLLLIYLFGAFIPMASLKAFLNFETILILIVTAIYLLIGTGFVLKGNIGLGVAYLAYAAANIGLIIVSLNPVVPLI